MKLTRVNRGGVYAGTISIQTNHSLHHTGVSLGGVGVEIDHDTSFVTHRNLHRRSAIPFTKAQRAAHPSVFLKGFTTICFDHDVWSKSEKLNVSAGFALDAMHRADADYGDRGFVKDAMFEIHQFEITAVTTRNLLH
jgi:hypothetical protein